MAYTAKDPRPPWRFLYLTETPVTGVNEKEKEEEKKEKSL